MQLLEKCLGEPMWPGCVEHSSYRKTLAAEKCFYSQGIISPKAQGTQQSPPGLILDACRLNTGNHKITLTSPNLKFGGHGQLVLQTHSIHHPACLESRGWNLKTILLRLPHSSEFLLVSWINAGSWDLEDESGAGASVWAAALLVLRWWDAEHLFCGCERCQQGIVLELAAVSEAS